VVTINLSLAMVWRIIDSYLRINGKDLQNMDLDCFTNADCTQVVLGIVFWRPVQPVSVARRRACQFLASQVSRPFGPLAFCHWRGPFFQNPLSGTLNAVQAVTAPVHQVSTEEITYPYWRLQQLLELCYLPLLILSPLGQLNPSIYHPYLPLRIILFLSACQPQLRLATVHPVSWASKTSPRPLIG